MPQVLPDAQHFSDWLDLGPDSKPLYPGAPAGSVLDMTPPGQGIFSSEPTLFEDAVGVLAEGLDPLGLWIGKDTYNNLQPGKPGIIEQSAQTISKGISSAIVAVAVLGVLYLIVNNELKRGAAPLPAEEI